jgi:hypothetical protein
VEAFFGSKDKDFCRKLEDMEQDGMLELYLSIRHRPPVPWTVTFLDILLLQAMLGGDSEAESAILQYIKGSRKRHRDGRLPDPSDVVFEICSAESLGR